MATGKDDILWKPYLQKRLRIDGIRGGKHLGSHNRVFDGLQCGLSGNRVLYTGNGTAQARKGNCPFGDDGLPAGKANPTYDARFTWNIATIFYNYEETLLKQKLEARQDRTDNKQKARHSGGKSASRVRWLITIFLMALTISAVFSFFSQQLLGKASLFGAFVVLLTIIAIGIFFDLLGVAVTAAEEKPFHSMASRKVPGGSEGIWLLRNAGKVSSVCNDVVGDICGIISGTAAAVVAVEAWASMQSLSQRLVQLLLSALVAALTILGKAFCKQIALDNSTAIVHGAAKLIWRCKHLVSRKKKK